MIDLAYSFGMAFWAIPADNLLDPNDAEARAFVAEFDLIAGNTLFLPREERGAAARAERLTKIRAAAEANPGKLLLVGNDLTFENAVPLGKLDGKNEIQPLSLYTWRYVFDLGRKIPGTITDTDKLFIEGSEVEGTGFFVGKILRGEKDVLIPANDTVSAQFYAALVAAGRHGEDALTIPMKHLAALYPQAQGLWAAPAPAIVDAVCYLAFVREVEEKVGHHTKPPAEIAETLAASRNEVETDITLTNGAREIWRLLGRTPLWQRMPDGDDLLILRNKISLISDEETGVAISPIHGIELLVRPNAPWMIEIVRRLEAAYGAPQAVSIDDEEGTSHLRLYKGATHYALLHQRDEHPADLFTWDRLAN